jgi:predicted metalloprotease with PDZ domain
MLVRRSVAVALVAATGCSSPRVSSTATPAASAAPIRYVVRMPDPANHLASIEARIPSGGKPTVELMMAVWSPGYYVREDYATRIRELSASSAAGRTLAVTQPRPNRWTITTGGADEIILRYSVYCGQRSVTGSSVDTNLAVLNGAPTYITLAEQTPRAHEVAIELPPRWRQTATSLTEIAGRANDYRAATYDELVDSPIVAGNLSEHEFRVAGARHVLVDLGDIPATWDGALAAANLRKFVVADSAFWGFLPFRKYVFLNVFRRGGGGLEHLNSTLLTSSPASQGGGDLRWLYYVSHEYFHAFNVKRLRPVELGPFDYELPPKTASLWLAEGVTTYYGDLLAARGGLGTPENALAALSVDITALQTSPGRLVQTLEQSSLGIFATGGSGIGGDRNSTVSYYVKGNILGWLSDARIQHATNGAKSLDDVMRLAYARYSGPRGYTPAEWIATASAVAGTDLGDFYRRALTTTEELDYSEALDWFGLRFAPSVDPAKAWTLEQRRDATPAQVEHLRRWTARY